MRAQAFIILHDWHLYFLQHRKIHEFYS